MFSLISSWLIFLFLLLFYLNNCLLFSFIGDQNPNPGIPPPIPPPGNPYPPPIPAPMGMFWGINPEVYNNLTIPASIPYNNSITSCSLKCSNLNEKW